MSDSITITTISAIDDASRRSAAVVIPASKHLSLRELIIGEDSARDLVAKLTAWLDAPRLAARKTPTVVASDAGVELLRTAAGEWASVEYPADHTTAHADTTLTWYGGAAAERNARTDYANARGKALCICGAECAEDEIDRSGDEPQCPKCVAEAVAAFKAQWFRCPLCGWTGTGAVRIAHDENADTCPGCDGFDFEEITP